ncbi:MAG: hypothetical protein Q8O67_30375 [Deltaproteobacteria bacterium]|nr:hypothetical protein [Deltaproteobacteria bacterium]
MAPLRCFLVLAVLAATTASAEGPSTEQMQRAQVEHLRAEMANHLHLRAFDLLDELVYSWTQNPPFGGDTAVVVADVTVPYGFGSGLEALIENHLADLVISHGETHVRLAHCPACRAVTVRSEAKATVISRGIDQPGTLARITSTTGSQHALFLDFEAEGTALVLRATITGLGPGLPIVYARTLSSSTSSAALLRAGDHLISAEEARQQYLDALQERGPLTIPVRLSVSQFAPPADGGGIAPLPFIWLQTGAELSINNMRDWTGSLTVGGSWIPALYSGFIVQARVNRLLTGSAVSLTQPNLYGYAGASLITVQGPQALVLRDVVPNLADVIQAATGVSSPQTTYPSVIAGLDLRIGNRLTAGVFAEWTPTLNTSPSVGRWLDFGIAQVHAIGGEVALCF